MKTNHLLILIFSVFALGACHQKPEEEEEKKPVPKSGSNHLSLSEAQWQQSGFQFGKPEVSELPGIIQVQGILDVPPQNLSSVSAMASGFVKKTDLLQGTHVHKGDVLVTLQSPEFISLQEEYLSNRSKLAFLAQEAERQQGLAEEKVASAKLFQQSKSEYESLKARQNGLRQKLKMLGFSIPVLEKGEIRSELEIRSPADGYVTDVFINPGKFIQPQDLICEIVNPEHLHSELYVYEKDISQIKNGQIIRFHPLGKPGEEQEAEVYLISRKINADRTVRVHGHLKKDNPSLIPNMAIQAVIEVGNRRGLTLPLSAVISFGGEKFVFAARKGQGKRPVFEKIVVKTGTETRDKTEIISSEPQLRTGDEIVISGAHLLLSVLENSEEEAD